MSKTGDAPKVGDTVWIFDINRRVYANGGHGAPIYAEHWYGRVIESESRLSWLLSGSLKVDKATGEIRQNLPGQHGKVQFSREAVDADIWRNDNAGRITQAVNHCFDAETLRAIDALLKADVAKKAGT